MPQIATVGLVGGFRDDGGIGTQEEPAVFRRKPRAAELLSPWKWRESNSPSPRPCPQRRGCPAVRRGQEDEATGQHAKVSAPYRPSLRQTSSGVQDPVIPRGRRREVGVGDHDQTIGAGSDRL